MTERKNNLTKASLIDLLMDYYDEEHANWHGRKAEESRCEYKKSLSEMTKADLTDRLEQVEDAREDYYSNKH